MSFGGGGGGGLGVTAHFHNSAIAGEGGSLKIANGVNSTQFTVGSGTTNIPLAAMVQMVTPIASKSKQGISFIVDTGDVPIQTNQQMQSATQNANERTGVTIAPVPAGKELIITSITSLTSAAFDMDIWDSPNSASTTGATNIGQLIQPTNTLYTFPVYYKIAAGRYFVLREAGGGTSQIYCQGILGDT